MSTLFIVDSSCPFYTSLLHRYLQFVVTLEAVGIEEIARNLFSNDTTVLHTYYNDMQSLRKHINACIAKPPVNDDAGL